MEKRRYYDGIIGLGWFVAVSILDALTTNRILRFTGAVTIGFACYAITSKPRTHFVLFLVALLALAGCWVNEDRITAMLTQMFARHFS
jgi:uncharacterized membrane protein